MLLKILSSTNRLVNLCIPKVNLHINIARKTHFKKNVFKTAYHQKALVSYISEPFLKKGKKTHTNYFECLYAAEALSSLGYNVDVVDYDHREEVSFNGYEIIYGFGNQFEASFQDFGFKGKRIVYSPGCNTVYSNMASCLRLKTFTDGGGIPDIRLIRAVNDAWPLQKYLSDAIICLGNQFVTNTYKEVFPNIKYYQINCFPLQRKQPIQHFQKDFKKVKNNLLWFGSQGSIHKGLDIALKLVEKNPNLSLYIRGLNMKHESAILSNYHHLIKSNRVNIKQHVIVDSDEFVELMKDCGCIIFPSASEGGAAAILTTISHGRLIPIITKSCGLDIENFGFVAKETTTESVEEQLNTYLSKSETELSELSEIIKNEIDTNYTPDNYRRNIKAIIEDILK